MGETLRFAVIRLLEKVFVRDSGSPILEFLEVFWILLWYSTGTVFEKMPFLMLVLELFLNSEFLTINFLGHSIYDCLLFGSLLCDKK